MPASSRQRVRMESESLPTGIAMPSAGHSASPMDCTVSYRSASSPGSPQAAIQFAESLTSPSARTSAAAMLVIASPTAMRPDAGASRSAMAGRSPSAIASPVAPERPEVVTATSLTGTCQGPTSGSRLIMPPDAAIADRDQEALVRDGRQAQQALEGVAKLPRTRRRSRRRADGGARRSSASAADDPAGRRSACPRRVRRCSCRPPRAARRLRPRRSLRTGSARGRRAR